MIYRPSTDLLSKYQRPYRPQKKKPQKQNQPTACLNFILINATRCKNAFFTLVRFSKNHTILLALYGCDRCLGVVSLLKFK